MSSPSTLILPCWAALNANFFCRASTYLPTYLPGRQRASGACVCVRLLTQVHVGGLGSLRVRRSLVHGVQQLLLHLRHRVAVEALHRHLRRVLVLRVHAVQRLQGGVRGRYASHTLAGALAARIAGPRRLLTLPTPFCLTAVWGSIEWIITLWINLYGDRPPVKFRVNN